MSNKTCLSYLRVSDESQLNGDGFPRQRDAVSRYAHAHDLHVIAEYRDEGVPGKLPLADRPGLSALRDRIAANGVRVVLVERADRLARDLMVSEMILQEFRDLGVTVIAADSGTDLTVGDGDPTRTLIRQVLGSVAQFEKSALVAKLKGARERKRRETGRCEGRLPFGAKPGEEATLAQIRLLRRKPNGKPRRSFAQIAAHLNATGVPTRTGRPWAPATVYKIFVREWLR